MPAAPAATADPQVTTTSMPSPVMAPIAKPVAPVAQTKPIATAAPTPAPAPVTTPAPVAQPKPAAPISTTSMPSPQASQTFATSDGSMISTSSMQSAINVAKADPTGAYAKELMTRIQAGNYNNVLKAMGIDTSKYGAQPAATPQANQNTAQPSEDLGSMDADAVQQGAQTITSSVERGAGNIQSGEQEGGIAGAGKTVYGVGEAGVGTAAGLIQSLLAPATALIRKGVDIVSNNKGVQAVAQSAPVSSALDHVNKISGAVDDWVNKNLTSDQQADLKNTLTTALGAVGGDAGIIPMGDASVSDLASTAGSAIKNTATDVGAAVKNTAASVGTKMDTVADRVLNPSAANPKQSIVDSYNKAIKPSVSGKNSAPQIAAHENNVVNAVKTIADNKANLSFTDQDGEVESGRTPQTPHEFASAIDQTKRGIFDQYNKMATDAGGKGATVDTTPIHTDLDNVINNEALGISNPGAVRYAQDLKGRLSDMDADGVTTPKVLSAQTTQDLIQNYNSSLDAFYKNPSYDNATHAAIDAGVARGLRTGLDSSITNASGPGYQALKTQYGALKSIEKEVARRSIVLARQAGSGAAGLGKYVDVLSGGDMVNGLLSLHPAIFAKGAAQGIFTRIYQYLNSPDRAIQSMFDSVQHLTPNK